MALAGLTGNIFVHFMFFATEGHPQTIWVLAVLAPDLSG